MYGVTFDLDNIQPARWFPKTFKSLIGFSPETNFGGGTRDALYLWFIPKPIIQPMRMGVPTAHLSYLISHSQPVQWFLKTIVNQFLIHKQFNGS